MTYAQRFINLKTQVGGNREIRGFEWTFGTPVEMKSGITMPAAHIRRILSELDFAIKLHDELGGAFTAELENAFAVLEAAMQTEGVLTRAAAQAAEEALLPLAPEAQKYEVLCAAHAHIDMNWMWGWQETVAATLSTFRTMLRLMDEYPQFCFSQSQASVYHIVETYDPEMMEEIKARIREGRWEITASAWVETDKNMPDTESLVRHIRLTKEYLRAHWDVDPDSLRIDFSPDTFGHSAHIPEIDTQGGVRYMYHCRAINTNDVIYRWQSPSGAELLVCREPYWYNSGITPHIGTGLIELSHHSGGLKTGLIVYGVGNHGGGPTRRDVDRIVEMQDWPVFPQVRFGTFRAYFEKAETVREKLNVVKHEMNVLFTGCYTTQSRIKRANRGSEAALLDAETLCALGGTAFPRVRRDKAWQNVLFTHFHDILTGSCVQESREHAMGLLAESMAIAQTASSKAMTALGERIDTSCFPVFDCDGTQSEGAGAGYGIESYAGVPNPERGRGRTRAYTCCNPCAFERDEVVELTLWDWPFDLNRLIVLDSQGQPLPFEMLNKEPIRYWDHLYIKLAVRVHLPALGYAALCVTEQEAQRYLTHRYDATQDRVERATDDFVLENEHLRAVFSRMDGGLVELWDKHSGKQQLTGKAQLLLVDTQANNMSAWSIGRWLGTGPLTVTRAERSGGAVLPALTIEQHIRQSKVKLTVSLPAGARALKLHLEADWNETSAKDTSIPLLVYHVPVAGGVMRMDVPAGVIDRQPEPLDKPGLTFAARVAGERAVLLSSDCKYGYRYDDMGLSVSLINSAHNPDPYPERGMHVINLWLGVSDAQPLALKNMARGFCHPPVLCSTGLHRGELPPAASLMGFESKTCFLSSLAEEDGCIVARVAELCGEADVVSLHVPGAVGAELVDGLGRAVGTAEVHDGYVKLPVRPFGMAAVKMH